MDAFERSAPSSSTSKPSLRSTVPPARRACSKSKSVRETRRPAGPFRSLDATGWRPVGNAEGGTGDRGDGCLKSEARVEEGERLRWRGRGRRSSWRHTPDAYRLARAHTLASPNSNDFQSISSSPDSDNGAPSIFCNLFRRGVAHLLRSVSILPTSFNKKRETYGERHVGQ